MSLVLVDYQIKGLCESNFIKPYDSYLVNPNSIDVRIGNSAIFETPLGLNDEISLEKTSAENPILIKPQEFFLSCTLEVFNFPSYICGEFKLKSSRAREGWGHSLAGWIDSCFNNSVLTLELRNNLTHGCLPLYKGLKIGQIILFQCDCPLVTYAETGRYNNFL